MRRTTPFLALLLGALLAAPTQAEVLEGDLARTGPATYELRVGSRSYSLEGQIPAEVRVVGEGRVRLDALRGATTLLVRELVEPRLETFELEVSAAADGAWSGRLGERSYSLAGRTHLLERLGVQGRVSVQGYRQDHDARIVIQAVRGETTGISLTRVARYIPVPPPIRFTVPRGLIRKGREVWIRQADEAFVTVLTPKGQERLIKRGKVSLTPRTRRRGITSGLSSK